ncbi:MAG: NUDIX domain-containing protein [Caulobacteraceae bacterium]|nr:NUDIX domain-containing protein [Caulobacteraceae bacterium]
MRERSTARVLLLDPHGRILLMKGRLPGAPSAPGAWFTVGGGIEAGEDETAAAWREIREETGWDPQEVGPVLWRNELTVSDRKGRPVLVREAFLVAKCAGGEPSRDGWVALEREFVDDIRWWTLEELLACEEDVYPADLAQRLADILALAESDRRGE